MKISRFKLAIVAELILLIGLLIFIASPPTLPLSPLSLIPPKNYNLQPKTYVILGFAPYWNQKKLTPESLTSISHYAYFALHLDESGDVQTHVNRRELEPGFNNYNRLLQSLPNKPLILTFMQKDQDSLSSILASKTIRSHAISTIISKVKESSATGVNIDFEPTGEISTTMRDNFTLFIQELSASLKPNNYNLQPILTISVYPSAAARPRLWDLVSLAPYTDYVVVMTYDYTMPKSTTSGPNSPLRDASGNFEHNIVKNISELSSQIEPKKILLGIPFYGYEWDTVDESKYSPTVGRGVTASLERIEEMLNERTLELVWDRNSLTAYGVATVGAQTSQIYFDNDVSLRLKLDFVKDAGLGGIAIWALGYDNNVPWLWPTIQLLNE